MSRTILLGILIFSVVGVITVSLTRSALGHCQIPCGIYDDPLRLQMLREDAVTIDKAMREITNAMAEMKSENGAQEISLVFNQTSRWVTVKEDAAQNIQDIICNYFLTQRVKAVDPGMDGYESYVKQLSLNHAVLVAAMKCKQNVDPKYAAELMTAVEALSPYYATVYPALQHTESNQDGHSHDHDHGHDHSDGHSHD